MPGGVPLLGLLSFIVAVLLLCAGPGMAQSTYGSLTGTVVDSSGAVEAGATVTLTNVGTAEKQTQATGDTGLYSFVNLYPGQYRVTVDKPGFKRTDRQNVVVQVQQTTRLDITLTVGQATETVTVTAEAPLLQSETSSLGQVVETRSADELPLNGRNVFSLVQVAPSVVMQGQAGSGATTVNPFAWGNFQIGGSFANQSAEYLDGQPLNIGYVTLPILIPTQDSIGEFKVQTNNIGPEWGKVAGGVMNLSTKGGTNNFHGEGYEYIRNKVLNANDWISNEGGPGQTPLPRPPFTQNQYGGNAGGKIFRDKTFFFGSWESFRLRQGVTYKGTVPTQSIYDAIKANANGTPTDVDLNPEYKNDLTDPTTAIVDPCAGNPVAYAPSASDNVFGNGGCQPLGVGESAPTPTQFMGTDGNSPNVIPGARVNPTDALLFIKAFPAPTDPTATSGNYVRSYGAGGNQNQAVARIDQKISDKQHIFGRYSYWNNLNQPTDPLGTGFCRDRCTELMTTFAMAIGYNYVFTPNVIGNLNISASRFRYNRNLVNSGYDLSQVDWPSRWNAEVPDADRTPPTPFVAGFVDDVMSSLGAGSFIQNRDAQGWLSPTLTVVHGRHTFQLGLQFQLDQDDYTQTNTATGTFGFTGSYTTPLGAKTSYSLADYILGWAQNPMNITNHFYGAAQNVNFVAARQYVYGGYINDTYHATGKLTLNLGVRYDVQTPWTERHDRLVDFNATEPNPFATAATGSTVLGNVDLVNSPGNTSRYALNLSHKGVAPRLGFAYSVDPKTVVRGGYGVFWIPIDTPWATHPLNDPTSSAQTNYTGNNGNGAYPINTMSTPWTDFIEPPGRATCTAALCPGFPSALSIGSASEVAWQLQGATIPGINVRDYKYAYTQQWNLDIQRTLWGGWFADVAYAGNKGTHLPQYAQQVNQISDSYLATAAQQAAGGDQSLAAIDTSVPNPFANYSYPGSALAQANITKGQLLRPFPMYSGVEYAGQGSFGSNYHALEATLQKRFAGGGTLLAAYTYSKLLSNTDSITSWLEAGGDGAIQDWNNLKGEKSLSSQEVGQHLIVSYVLDVPVGKNKKYLNNLSGPADKIVSGWGIDGVTTFQDGFPVNISASTANGTGNWGGGLRPNVVPGVNKATSGSKDARVKSGSWINPLAFQQPATYTFGTESRVDSKLRTDGLDNWDFAAFKRTPIIGEKLAFEFRAELFNTFNHVQFGPPSTGFGSSTFGQVNSQFNNPRLVQFAGKIIF
jgi:hypothetical protein